MARALTGNTTQRPGFTLVELIVVLGILVVLMSILFPAISAARRAARQTQDHSILRQFGIACHGYASANGGALPVGTRERSTLTPGDGDDLVWFSKDTYDQLAGWLRADPRSFSCNALWDSEFIDTEVGSTANERKAGTKIGLIYFGNRKGHSPVQFPSGIRYVLPRRMGDESKGDKATSDTLATCLVYVPGSDAWWPGMVPHQKQADGELSVSPGTPLNQVNLRGLNVLKLDGSVAWTPRDELKVVKDINLHYYAD